MAYLSAMSGATSEKRYDLAKKVIVMGRHPSCDVIVEEGAVSRKHAQIEHTPKGYQLVDLKSRNGTFLNGQLIDKPSELRDGDLIRICDIEYAFHELPEPASSEIVIGSAKYGVSLVDDWAGGSSGRELQSKLDILGSSRGPLLTTSAETRLQAVLEITRNLGRSLRLDEVLPKVLDTLFKVFLQADRAFVVLAEGDKLIPKWVKTRSEEQHENFRISRTIMREVMEAKEAIISLDASNDKRFDMAQSIANFRIRSMLVAPLLDSNDQAIGAIQIDTLDSKRQFTTGDLEILAAIAIQAGIAIENAQLHQMAVEQNRIEQDLSLARQVQQAFLPSSAPQIKGFQFFNHYQPADLVGGDYFDYVSLGGDHLVVLMADVVGHGIAAALLMAKLSTETRSCLAINGDLSEAVSHLNRRICGLKLERFVTLLCVKLHLTTGAVDVVNAGHMLPVWKQTTLNRLQQPGEEESGIPLGIDESYKYQSTSFLLEPGDELLLYTDGINEAPDSNGSQFGHERILKLAAACQGELHQLGEAIIHDVNAFTKNTRQADDMCLVLLRRDQR